MVKNDWPIIDRWWPKRDEWSRLKFGSFLLSLFLLLGALPYGLINRLSAWRGTSTLKVEMALDWELPFVAWMVIPTIRSTFTFPGQLGWVLHRSIDTTVCSFSNVSSSPLGSPLRFFSSSPLRLNYAPKPTVLKACLVG